MGVFKIFDAYTLRARIFPALVASAAVIVGIVAIIPWDRLSWAHAIASAAVPIILYVVADIARQLGRKLETKLYKKWGGKPSTVMLRHTESDLADAQSKAFHLSFLGKKIGATPPTEAQATADPAAADVFYERCGNWLRENTRSTKKFGLLFAENITYGFRRNLLAVKCLALVADFGLILAAGAYALFARPELDSEPAFKAIVIALSAAAHVLFMWRAISERNVHEAAKSYARQLFLCCNVLNTQPTNRRNTAARSGAGATTKAPTA